MKKILLTTVLFAGVSVLLHAQNRVATPSTNVLNSAAIQQGLLNSKISSLVCDTVTNFDLLLYSPTVYLDNAGGYVSGHNSYGDQSKADKFGISTTNSVVDAVLYLVGVATSSGTGQACTARIWDNNGSGGLPNTVLASDSIPYDTLVANLSTFATLVDFVPDVPVSDTIYVGVHFEYTVGDTLALLTSTDGDGPVNTAYEQFDIGTWYPYSDATNSWGLTVSHAVFLFVCTSTGIHEMVTPSGNLTIVPNPSSTGIFTIVVPNHDLSKPVTINVYDSKGAVVYSSQQSAAANKTYQLNLPEAAKGVYMVKVETSSGIQTQKLTIN
ncbi:MAG: T9SS type A sorting domain-containing protein [Bacteroidia bacterium]